MSAAMARWRRRYRRRRAPLSTGDIVIRLTVGVGSVIGTGFVILMTALATTVMTARR